MNRKLIATALLALSAAGCVSTYSYRSDGGGDYYYAEPSVDVVWWGEPWGTLGWHDRWGWYGSLGYGYGAGLRNPWYRGGYGYGGYGFPWYDPWAWQYTRPPYHRPPQTPPPPGPPGPPPPGTPPPGVIIGDNEPPVPEDPGLGGRERRPRWWTPSPPEVGGSSGERPGERPRARPVQPGEPGDAGVPRRVRVAQPGVPSMPGMPGVPAEPGEAPRMRTPGVPSEPGARAPRPVSQPAAPRAEAPPRPRGMEPGGGERARPAPMPRSEPAPRPSGGGRMEMRERETGQ